MPDGRTRCALIDAGMQLELDVAHESGLEEALGGREATRATLEAAWAPLQAQALALDSSSATTRVAEADHRKFQISARACSAPSWSSVLRRRRGHEEIPAGRP